MLLYRQQVRELKLAAAFVDDPQQVTPDQMRLWADGFANTELVEQVEQDGDYFYFVKNIIFHLSSYPAAQAAFQSVF
jgi:hypothetical protein